MRRNYRVVLVLFSFLATKGAMTVLLVFALSLVGCSGRPSADELPELPKTIEECETYLNSYARCLHGLGSSDAVVKQRVRAAHQTFVGRDEAALKAQCTAASAQMKAACR